jgi:hypothetical protein
MADIFAQGIIQGKATEMCDLLVANIDSTLVDKMTALNGFKEEIGLDYLNYEASETYGRRSSIATTTHQEPDNWIRQWNYQWCTQLGWYQVPSSKKTAQRRQIDTASFFRSFCHRTFNRKMGRFPDVDKEVNDQFKGEDTEVERLIVTNGIDDPWQWASLRESKDPTLKQLVRMTDCKDCSNEVELYTPKDDDDVEVQNTRKMILDTIQKWLLEE